MPPKANGNGGSKSGLSQDEFLAACFQCTKEKITIDYDKLAAITGMSKGGAQNKYRDLTKKLDLLAPASDSAPTTPAGKTTTAKRKTAVKSTTDHGSASDNEEVEATRLAKKARASVTKKSTAKPVKKSVQEVLPLKSELEVKAEESADEVATRGEEDVKSGANPSKADEDEA